MQAGIMEEKRPAPSGRAGARRGDFGYRRGGRPRPFSIDGVLYPSIVEASRSLEWATASGLAQAARLGKRYKGHEVAYAASLASGAPAPRAPLPAALEAVARDIEAAQGFPLDGGEAELLAEMADAAACGPAALRARAERERAAACEAARQARAACDEAERRAAAAQWMCLALARTAVAPDSWEAAERPQEGSAFR